MGRRWAWRGSAGAAPPSLCPSTEHWMSTPPPPLCLRGPSPWSSEWGQGSGRLCAHTGALRGAERTLAPCPGETEGSPSASCPFSVTGDTWTWRVGQSSTSSFLAPSTQRGWREGVWVPCRFPPGHLADHNKDRVHLPGQGQVTWFSSFVLRKSQRFSEDLTATEAQCWGNG